MENFIYVTGWFFYQAFIRIYNTSALLMQHRISHRTNTGRGTGCPQGSFSFSFPPFLGFAEAGQYNKGCENTNALPKHFLQGWVMMDAGPLKEPSTWGSSVLVRWGYSSQKSPASRWAAIGKGRGERHWTLQEICREETDTGFAK